MVSCMSSFYMECCICQITSPVRLKAQFPDHHIKTIRLDNPSEFSSQAFLDYCMSIGIDVQYSISHVHTQNGLVESFIKRLQLIVRPLLINIKLPLSA